jgi:hypothetical protein
VLDLTASNLVQLDGQKLYNFLLTCVCQNFSQNTICITRVLLYKTTGDVILDNFFPKANINSSVGVFKQPEQ